jgi:hypothetical protein
LDPGKWSDAELVPGVGKKQLFLKAWDKRGVELSTAGQSGFHLSNMTFRISLTKLWIGAGMRASAAQQPHRRHATARCFLTGMSFTYY